MNDIIIILIIFVLAAVASTAGIGGGTMFVPALLLMDYSFHEASTISLFLITVTGFSAFLRYRKARLVDWQMALVMELFSDAGSFTGGYTSIHFKPELLEIMFAVVLFIIAVLTIRGKAVNSRKTTLKKGRGYWVRHFSGMQYSIPIYYMIPVAFVAGYLSGLMGISGGVIKIPLMILWFNIPAKVTVATSSMMVSLTALTGLGGHIIHTHIDWKLAVILAVAAFIGGQLGSKFSLKLPESTVKKVIGYILMAIALLVAFQTILSRG